MTEPGLLLPPAFLPWLRNGLAAFLDAPAQDGLATADSASVTVTVVAAGSGPGGDSVRTVPSPVVRLVGPGEVLALDPSQIVRREPAPGEPDAEPNYFAQVELAAPDLPWRFTPASPGADRLQPWLALVVVIDGDGVDLAPAAGARLPVLTVDDPAAELPDLAGCWAWAHVQADHDLAGGLEAALSEAPEAFRARLLCPRRLKARTAWLACLVPTFAAGRQAGLGEPVTATGLAWEAGAAGPVRLPVYDAWRFSTGPKGDFESLVRRLRPRELPGGVGRRDLDVSDPGGGLPRAPGTLLTYEGALVSPAGGARPWPTAHRDTVKAALAELVGRRPVAGKAPQPYDALRDDPVVGPPAYTSAQAGLRSVPPEGQPPVWFGELNTEPVHRAVAGVGAEVVRADQEALMAAAWAHAEGLGRVNRVLGRARFAWELGTKAAPGVKAVGDARLLQLAGPALARLAHPRTGTCLGALGASDLPDGLVSAAFRRITSTQPGFTTARREGGRARLTDAVTASALAAPTAFTAVWHTRTVAAGTELQGPLPDVGQSTANARANEGAGPALRGRPGPAGRRGPLEGPVQGPVQGPTQGPVRGSDGLVEDLVDRVRAALDPAATIRAMVDTRVLGLPSARPRTRDVPHRVRAHPDFLTPMSERLVALSVEYLVPGVGAIPDDTVGVLEVNHAFLEAFLAGFNHELGREFQWREYPASPGSTWARRFFDSGPVARPDQADPVGKGPQAAPADISPIGRWAADAPLGSHAPEGTPTASLVLLVKGALPRRYPDLRVYAVEAEWTDEGTRGEKPGGQLRVPVLAGQLEPDTFFWGFELTESEARGRTDPALHKPGWFFVLEQQPGATRFGLDGPQARLRGTTPRQWTALSWSHLAPPGDGPLPSFVDPFGPEWLAGVERPGNGGDDTWGEDAAAMARITFQRPVRMLVHADSMLPAPFDAGDWNLPGGGPKGPFDPQGPIDPQGPRGPGPGGRGRPRRPRGGPDA